LRRTPGGKFIRMFQEVEPVVDVELLAAVGNIAQRLRDSEQKWTIDLKDLQKKTLHSFGKPPLPTTESVAEKLSEIFEDSPPGHKEDDDPRLVTRLRYLEDTVIKIHYQQELLKQTDEQKQTTNKKAPIKSNMNYSAAVTKNNNNGLTTSTTGIHELGDDLESCSADIECGREKKLENVSNDDSEIQRDPTNCSTAQCQNITGDDMRMLIRELKRKVDFTEKMNWLCKYEIESA
jgi:hypothetical protein